MKASKDKFPPPSQDLVPDSKIQEVLIFLLPPRSKEFAADDSRSSPLTIAYIIIIFKKEPWEGGRVGRGSVYPPALGV